MHKKQRTTKHIRGNWNWNWNWLRCVREGAKKCHSAKIWWQKTPTKTGSAPRRWWGGGERQGKLESEVLRHKECMYVAGELTKANTWHLALFDVVSGHVGARLPEEARRDARRDIVGHSCRCRDGRADLQTMHMAVNTLDDSATPRAATSPPPTAMSCHALRSFPSYCPFSGCRLNLLPSGISFRVQVEEQEEQTFPKCDKTTNRQKKKGKKESSECEREIEKMWRKRCDT